MSTSEYTKEQIEEQKKKEQTELKEIQDWIREHLAVKEECYDSKQFILKDFSIEYEPRIYDCIPKLCVCIDYGSDSDYKFDVIIAHSEDQCPWGGYSFKTKQEVIEYLTDQHHLTKEYFYKDKLSMIQKKKKIIEAELLKIQDKFLEVSKIESEHIAEYESEYQKIEE